MKIDSFFDFSSSPRLCEILQTVWVGRFVGICISTERIGYRINMKRFLILTVCLLFAGLTACGKKEEEPYIEPEPVAVYNPEKPTTLVLAEYGNNNKRSEALRLIADKYEYDNPNVTIEMIDFPKSLDEGQRILQAGDKIDIFEVNDSTASSFINSGHAAEITDYTDEWMDGYTISIGAKWSMHYYDRDRTYFIPNTIFGKALYYRADLLEKEELPIPRFFHTVDSFGKQVMENEGVEYGLVMPLAEENRYKIADYFIWSNVGMGNIADIGNAYFVKDDSSKTVFSLPAAKDALETLKKLYSTLGPSSALEMSDEDTAQIFADGKTFMAISDSKGIDVCESKLDDDDWIVYPLPLGAADLGVIPNEFQGWAINSGAENEPAAGGFLLYLSNSDNTTYLARLTGSIPIHSDAIELDKFFSDSHFSGFQLLANRAAIGLYHYVDAPKKYDAFLEYEAEINERYGAFFRGEVEAEELLSELDAYWTKAYEDEGQLWKTKPVVVEKEESKK